MVRKRKRKSKPTTAKRNKVQGVKDRYAHAREDAQLTGLMRYCEESVQMLFQSRAGTFLGDKLLKLLADGPMSKDRLCTFLNSEKLINVHRSE
jgi:hypothetical protein